MRTAAAALLLLAGIARGGDDPTAKADREELTKLYDAIANAEDPRWLRDARALRGAYESDEFVEGVRADVEVHGVALQRGDRTDAGQPSRATVRVTRKGCAVYLVLCGYAAIDWRIEVEPGVELVRVLVYGVGAQRVRGVAAARVTHKDRVFVLNHRDREYGRFSSVVARHVPGDRIHTYNGQIDPEGDVILVGPQSPVWRRQMMLGSMRDLERSALRERREREARDMGKTLFPLIAWTPGGSRHLCDASANGIVRDSLAAIPRSAFAVAVDPETGRRYVIDDAHVQERDAEGRFLRAIPLPPWIPQNWFWADIGFDARRRRLIAGTLTGHFAEFPMDTRAWRALGGVPNAAQLGFRGWGREGILTAMTWDAGRDCIWALFVSGGDQGLRRFSAEGTPDGQTQRVVLPVRIQQGPRNGTLIRMSGSRVVVFAAETTRNRRERRNARAYVVDPERGQLLAQNTLRDLPSVPAPAPDELPTLWAELNGPDCYSAMRRLGAGKDETVAFLRAEWDKQPVLADEELREVVRDLGAAHAARRWDAMRRLAQVGRAMRKELAKAVDAAESSHVRMALLLHLESLDEEPDLPRRLDRVLTAIGTPQALAFRAVVRTRIADER